jgi:hypothetical protein
MPDPGAHRGPHRVEESSWVLFSRLMPTPLLTLTSEPVSAWERQEDVYQSSGVKMATETEHLIMCELSFLLNSCLL